LTESIGVHIAVRQNLLYEDAPTHAPSTDFAVWKLPIKTGITLETADTLVFFYVVKLCKFAANPLMFPALSET
jgi:hypothetical protein